MSPAAAALQEAFNALNDTASGEPLTLLRAGGERASVQAIVNRAPRPTKERSPDFDPRYMSVIELKKDATSPIPKKGDTFIDGQRVKHFVGVVTPMDFTIQCECRKGWEA